MILSLLLTIALFLNKVVSLPRRAIASLSIDPTAEPWVNPNGGDLQIEVHEQRINWGSLRPADVVDKLREICGGQACQETEFELDTSVVQPDRKGVKVMKLRVTASQLQSSTGGSGQSGEIFAALKGFLESPHFVTSQEVAWDSETENVNCPAPATTCSIPNKMEGKEVQWTAPKYVSVRLEAPSSNAIVSQVNFYAKTEAEGGDKGDCNKITEVAGDIASMVEQIPKVGFMLGELRCVS